MSFGVLATKRSNRRCARLPKSRLGMRTSTGVDRATRNRGWMHHRDWRNAMKTIAATVLLSCCSCWALGQDKVAVAAAEAACGPQDSQFSVTSDESRHPTPTPESGKALIYVVGQVPRSTRVGADGKWLGALKRGTYFSASVDPGEHHLCARTDILFRAPRLISRVKGKRGRNLLLRRSLCRG